MNGGDPRPDAPRVGAGDLHFLMPETPTHVGTVLGGAGATHLVLLGVLLLMMTLRPHLGSEVPSLPPLFDAREVVFLSAPGLLGGGGGGGDRSPEPRRAPELAVQPIASEVIEPTPEPIEPEPVHAADIPAVPNEAPAAVPTPGPPALTDTRGPGNGPGVGTGDDGGIGDGRKGGAGTNQGPSIGEGPGGRGTATAPVPLNRPQPRYTSAAMQRGLEGEAIVTCTVTAGGTPVDCSIIKSLDGNAFGLDDQALKAASEFRFRPGMRGDVPVPVRVNIILEFNLR